MTQHQPVRIFLIDFSFDTTIGTQHLLKTKFNRQQKGILKYLTVRNDYLQNLQDPKHFPIELAMDKQFLLTYLPSLSPNRSFKFSYLCDEFRKDVEVIGACYPALVARHDKEYFSVFVEYLLSKEFCDEIRKKHKIHPSFTFLISNTGNISLSKIKTIFRNLEFCDFWRVTQLPVGIDDKFILEASRMNCKYFELASPGLQRNRKEVLELCKCDGLVLEHINAKLRLDEEIVLESLKSNPKSIQFVPNTWKYDRDLINQVLLHHFDNLSLEELSDDITWLLNFLKLFGIEHIPKTLSKKYSNHRELMLELVKADPNFLEIISPELRNDRELVFEAVKRVGDSIFYASDELKADREIVLEAVTNDPNIFKHIASNFSSDKEIIRIAVRRNPEFFNLASDNMRNEYEFALELVSINSYILRFLPETLRNDMEINLRAISLNGAVLEYSPFKQDNNMKLLAAKTCPYYLRFADTTLITDKNILKEYILSGVSVMDIPNFFTDEELILESFRFYTNLQYLGRYRDNIDFLLRAVDINLEAIDYIPVTSLTREVILKLISKSGRVIEKILDLIKDSDDFWEYLFEACKTDGFFIKFDDALYHSRMASEYYDAIITSSSLL